jgi:selenocysteine lyase/cysteine desulfurase
MSERSQFINTAIAIEALERILEWTPEKISEQLEKITDTIADAAKTKGYFISPKEHRSPHFIGLRRRQGFSADFMTLLQSRNVHAGLRGDCLRISPHLYTKERDLETLLNSI